MLYRHAWPLLCKDLTSNHAPIFTACCSDARQGRSFTVSGQRRARGSHMRRLVKMVLGYECLLQGGFGGWKWFKGGGAGVITRSDFQIGVFGLPWMEWADPQSRGEVVLFFPKLRVKPA